MQRLLPALAAFALVIAGVGGGILFLASKDHSSIAAETTPPAGSGTTSGTGPYGLPPGNVVITYGAQADRIRIDQLAERLGAIDTKAARTAGQALVSKKERAGTIVATNGVIKQEFPSSTDPQLAAFVRQHLGRTP